MPQTPTTPPSAANTVEPISQTTRGARWPTVIALTLGGIGLLLSWIAIFGGVHGVEINGDTLQRRTFSYYRIPGLRTQIIPVRLDNDSNQLVSYLAKQRLLEPGVNPVDRWDVVQIAQGWDYEVGDPSILTAYLDDQNPSGGHTWLRWTIAHPGLAKQLWPMVLLAVRLEAYTLVPILFQIATDFRPPDDAATVQRIRSNSAAQDVDTFRSELALAAKAHLVELAVDCEQLGRNERSVQLTIAAERLGTASAKLP